MEHNILCTPRRRLVSTNHLDEGGIFQGLSTDFQPYLSLLDNPDNRYFIPRAEAEKDLYYKQWIPYVIIARGTEILRYRRGNGSGESRLRGLWSIGVGGHINQSDCRPWAGYEVGLQREVREETGLDLVMHQPVAVINDDSDEVGQVHFGVVHVARVYEEDEIQPSDELSEAEFVELDWILQAIPQYEKWSQWCIEQILPELLRQPKPTQRL